MGLGPLVPSFILSPSIHTSSSPASSRSDRPQKKKTAEAITRSPPVCILDGGADWPYLPDVPVLSTYASHPTPYNKILDFTTTKRGTYPLYAANTREGLGSPDPIETPEIEILIGVYDSFHSVYIADVFDGTNTE